MTLWRYSAVDLQRAGQAPGSARTGAIRSGELAGESAAAVRASLRRIGLQAIDVAPLRRSRLAIPGRASVLPGVQEFAQRYLRGRRRFQCAEIYDSLATMLASGIPLLEAVDAAAGSKHRSGRSARLMLIQVRERLRTGGSLGQAMREHPAWFDGAEVAIVDAGQHAGNLHQVLSSLAQRHEHAGELANKLIGALAYPFIVLLVGIGVAIFLSVKTLPDLAKILTDAKVPIPALTANVMWIGQLVVHHWFMLMLGALVVVIGAIALPSAFRRMPWELPPMIRRLRKLRPRVIRTMAIGGLALRLGELIRSGVPMVEALRILAPTTRHYSLRQELLLAADSVERGDELSEALDDDHWFDEEFQRLLDIGQSSGELDQMLQRIGQRYQRQAKRLIDRLATLLEPAVILLLAVFVGTVVMAAILPLLRLQEVV